MARLVDDEGNILTNTDDIVIKEVNSSYETLFQKRNVEECEISDLR